MSYKAAKIKLPRRAAPIARLPTGLRGGGVARPRLALFRADVLVSEGVNLKS